MIRAPPNNKQLEQTAEKRGCSTESPSASFLTPERQERRRQSFRRNARDRRASERDADARAAVEHLDLARARRGAEIVEEMPVSGEAEADDPHFVAYRPGSSITPSVILISSSNSAGGSEVR